MIRPDLAPGSSRRPERFATLVIVVWLGALSGWVEVAGLTLWHWTRAPIMELGRDYFWMTPLATTVSALLIGLVVALAGMLLPRRPLVASTLFVGSSFAALELLLYVPGLHHAAAVLLALGCGAQAARMLRPGLGTMSRVAHRSMPFLVAMIPVAGGGAHVWRWWEERQALAPLRAMPAGSPNVIVITLDAVRAANLSLYGYSRSTSPRLDVFGQQGVIFERALSTAPWTLPSHASVFTGRWHHELSADYETPLDRTFPTLAEFLGAHGYATGGFVANLRYCGYESGLDRGFVHYDDYPLSLGQFLASSKLLRTGLNNFRLRRWIRNDQHLSRKPAEALTRQALGWVDHLGSRPFFLFINYFDAHEPYLPPPPFDRSFGTGRQLGKFSPLHRWLWEPAVKHSNMGPAQVQEEIDAYDGALAHLDHELGRLFDQLDRRRLLERTLVIVTADHGEEFGEHQVFEHGYSLARPSLQVPLVMRLPGVVPHGVRVTAPVSLRDLPATIVDVLGLTESPFPGRTLAAKWRAPSALEDDPPILAEVHRVSGHPDWFPVSKGDLRSVAFRGWRYIRRSDGMEELFDFEHDPWERTNLAGSVAFRSILTQYRNLLETPVPARRP